MFTYARVASPRRDRAILLAALAALVALAWIALVAWAASPAARYLHHEVGGTPVGGAPAGGAGLGLAAEGALFVAGWLLMIVAMMLPTSVPLVATFAALVGRRSNRAVLVALVVGGYVVAWSAFGLVAWLLDRGVHAGVAATPFLAAYPHLIAGATLAVAGAWQFSPLKYRCLDECRSPLGFVVERWRAERPRREAFTLGVAHGLFCIGCCWSMMLVMFGLGLGSPLWMLGLGAVMAIEKNAPWGRRVGRPLGVLLVVAAIAAVAG